MQDEVNEKTVSLCIRGGKITAQLLKAAMRKALAQMKQETAKPPRYFVFFKARDADVMTAAFKEYTGKSLNKTKKPSVRTKLKDAITQAKDKNREREKTKQKEKEPTL